MTLRKTISLTTLLSFVLLIFTSIILYVTPQGKIAFWADWKILGLDKEQWGALHTNMGLLFVIAGLIHTALNRNAIMSYLKTRAKKFRLFTIDFNLALVITLFVTLFTLYELPPISLIQHHNNALKNAAAKKYGTPPYGHAESSSLQSFCRRTGLNLDDAIDKLNSAGFHDISPDATLKSIAQKNNVSPQEVYNKIRIGQANNSSSEKKGFGRQTIRSICKDKNIDLTTVIQRLKLKGLRVNPDQSVRDIADAHGERPSAIYNIITETP